MLHKLLLEIKAILLFILPRKKKELILFFSLFVIYFSLGLYLACNSFILDFPYLKNDMGEIEGFLYDPYFSYDSNHYYHQGYQNIIGHPLVQLLLSPFLFIGHLLSLLFATGKAKTIFFVFCTSQLISLSVVYIHRYLENIVQLSGFILNLLVLFFAFFSTNIILSFTFESFCFSAFLLSLTCTYYSLKMKKEEQTSLIDDAFFSLSLGGITLTNFAKGIVSMFFVSENKKGVIKRIFILGGCLLVLLFANMFIYESNPLSDLSYRMNTFAGGTGFRGNLLERLIDSFWGSPILLPSMRTEVFYRADEIWHTVIDLDFYHGWWQYLFSMSLAAIVAAAFLMNIKNKYVIMLACLWGIDLVIHLGLAYGTKSLFLYGAHWVYVIPLVLGWLYRSLNERMRVLFKYTLVVLFAILLINNAIYLGEFFDLVMEYFSTPEWNV